MALHSPTNLRLDARGHIREFQSTERPAPYDTLYFYWWRLDGTEIVADRSSITEAVWLQGKASVNRGLQLDARGHVVAFNQYHYGAVDPGNHWYKLDGTPTSGGLNGHSRWELRLDARGHVRQFGTDPVGALVWFDLNAA